MKKPWQTHLYRLIQVAVFSVAAVYLYKITQSNFQPLLELSIPSWTVAWVLSVLSIIIYGLLMCLLASAWALLTQFRQTAITTIYLKSQALKYLPGNIFHFVYRHVESEKLGVPRRHLIDASIQETVWLIFCCLLTITTCSLALQLDIPLVQDNDKLLYVALGALGVFAIILFKRFKWPQFIVFILLYTGYFLGMGLIGLAVAKGLGIGVFDYKLITAVYAIAWVVGYLVPGAPGGLGVRETIFILMLSQVYQAYQVIAVIAAIRLVSVAAEALLYFTANQVSAALNQILRLTDKTKP